MSRRNRAVGIVVGLKQEARIARALGCTVAVGGGTREGAIEAADQCVALGARMLISFGFAGGIDPGVAPGTLVIPASVHAGGFRLEVDAAMAERLGGINCASVPDVWEPVAELADKRRMFERSRAPCVDIETGAVALAARKHKIGFAVLRAVADPAHRRLPDYVLDAVDDRGRVRHIRVMLGALLLPWRIPVLLRLGGDARRARQALADRVRQIGTLT